MKRRLEQFFQDIRRAQVILQQSAFAEILQILDRQEIRADCRRVEVIFAQHGFVNQAVLFRQIVQFRPVKRRGKVQLHEIGVDFFISAAV